MGKVAKLNATQKVEEICQLQDKTVLHLSLLPYIRKIWRLIKFGDLAVAVKIANNKIANIK